MASDAGGDAGSGWGLGRRLRFGTTGFGLVLALGIVLVLVTLSSASTAVDRETDRIFPARLAASQLLQSLLDQETGLRGYALSRNAQFLQPYVEGQARERVLRRRLGQLVGSAGPAADDLRELDGARTTWHTDYEMPRLASLRSSAGNAVDITVGKALFDQIRLASGRLDATLRHQLDVARANADRSTRTAVITLVAVAVVFLLALLLVQRGLALWVTRPLRELGEQVRHVSSGHLDQPITPSGPPDLQLMGRDVEQMRAELARSLAEVERVGAEIEQRSLELSRSNADLEQFAYVASHDLQEPLRKVASFCQLLEQRYGDELDDRGKQYIDFAVDGAKRMQRLINDLLTFSRVGRAGKGFGPVRLHDVVDSGWAALAQRVQDNEAVLEVDDDLPVVEGDASLLHLLLQNLLGNAVKYRQAEVAPRVRVTASERDGFAFVEVSDNGIGIPDEYAEKVFVIFQRLHGRDAYEGTGIGLALCKKVVEFHGGEISLRPSALGGACVAFTLPLHVDIPEGSVDDGDLSPATVTPAMATERVASA